MNSNSVLAEVIANPRNEANRRSKQATGVVFHTTGSNAEDRRIYQQAQAAVGEERARAMVDSRKIDYYDDPGANFPHYLVPWAELADGKVAWQVASEEDRAWAAGVGGASLQAYDSGSWQRTRAEHGELVVLDDAYPGYRHWYAKWPGVQSPSRLLEYHRTRDPNQLLQVEVVQPVGGPITDEQHAALARLLVEISERHGFDEALRRQTASALAKPGTMGWPPAVVSHGDVHPMARYNGKGEWDPGESPNFRRDLFWQSVHRWLQD